MVRVGPFRLITKDQFGVDAVNRKSLNLSSTFGKNRIQEKQPIKPHIQDSLEKSIKLSQIDNHKISKGLKALPISSNLKTRNLKNYLETQKKHTARQAKRLNKKSEGIRGSGSRLQRPACDFGGLVPNSLISGNSFNAADPLSEKTSKFQQKHQWSAKHKKEQKALVGELPLESVFNGSSKCCKFSNSKLLMDSMVETPRRFEFGAQQRKFYNSASRIIPNKRSQQGYNWKTIKSSKRLNQGLGPKPKIDKSGSKYQTTPYESRYKAKFGKKRIKNKYRVLRKAGNSNSKMGLKLQKNKERFDGILRQISDQGKVEKKVHFRKQQSTGILYARSNQSSMTVKASLKSAWKPHFFQKSQLVSKYNDKSPYLHESKNSISTQKNSQRNLFRKTNLCKWY